MAAGLPPIQVPPALRASHHRYFGPRGLAWIESLPALAADMCARWELALDGSAASGAVALVLPVVRADGSRAALKLQPVDDETRDEAAALRSWAGHGAVALLEHDPVSGSMLLDRLDAARSLATLASDLAALEIIAGLLLRLNAVAAPPGLRRLPDLAAAMLEVAPDALSRFADPVERRLLQTCARLLQDVLGERQPERLLHWDLHYENVLAPLGENVPAPLGENVLAPLGENVPAPLGPSAREPWLAIDPKPLSGDPGFELLPALWNRWDDVVATGDVPGAVLRRFDLMTEVMGLERGRAAVWTLARVLQDALWDSGLGETALDPGHRAIAEAVLTRTG